jgi:hypothetical protein
MFVLLAPQLVSWLKLQRGDLCFDGRSLFILDILQR